MPILRSSPRTAIDAADVRSLACFPLVPFSNRIADACLHWRGTTYPLIRYLEGVPHAIHGNGWQRAWAVSKSSPESVELELVHDASGARAMEWPFPFRARQTVSLSAHALSLELEIENSGDAAFPCGLGWHPYFPRNDATELQFAWRAMWETDRTMLPTRLVAASASDFSEARAIGDTTLDNCFTDWQPPATLHWPERGLSAAIGADSNCEFVIVYIPPNADYLAVEPVTHMTDAFNRADRGEPQTGTRVILPGARFSCTMQISVTHRPG